MICEINTYPLISFEKLHQKFKYSHSYVFRLIHEVISFRFNSVIRKQDVLLLSMSQPQAAAADFLSSLTRRLVIVHCKFSLYKSLFLVSKMSVY